MIRGAPYRFIYHLTDFFEGRDIQSGDQLVVKLVLWTERHEIQLRYFFDDIDVSGHAEFPELVPKYRSVESELSSPDHLYCEDTAHPPQVRSYLDKTLPICEVSPPSLQCGKDSGDILDSP
jgi:hypothetical protein